MLHSDALPYSPRAVSRAGDGRLETPESCILGLPHIDDFTRMTSQAMRLVEDWYALKLWFLSMKEIKGIKTEDMI